MSSAPMEVSAEVDDEFLRAAIEQSNLNVLRLTLYQLTGDPYFASLRVTTKPDRGGALLVYVVAEEHHEELKAKAFEYLKNLPRHTPPMPSREETRRLMELYQGRPMTPVEERFGYEELAFDEFPRDVQWTNKPGDDVLENTRVVIIGAGISGICAGIQLERLGIPYVIIERQGDIGGTWELNKYPGVRVDIPSALYQFKFEKNYPWREYFATGGDTQKYLRYIAEKYNVRPQMRFNLEVTTADWDESSSQWLVKMTNKSGAEETITANFLISGSGLFSLPRLPDIDGVEDYQGKIFHTTAWDQSFDYTGKRVALIGNGSSGAQLMPSIAESVQSLTAYQRTPAWIGPLNNYLSPVSPQLQWLLDNVPYYWNWYCFAGYLGTIPLQDLLYYDPEWQKAGGYVSERNDKAREWMLNYVQTKLADRPDLLAKSIPDYAPIGRRLVVDNGWYDALKRPNVELVTDAIDCFTQTGIRTVDGVERQFDLVVLGSGFKVHSYLWPVRYTGRDGITLESEWKKDGARSYLGMTMPGFPNFFMYYGPNGQPSTVAFYSWAEIWTRYIVGSIVSVLESGKNAIEVKRDVFEDYNERMDAAFDGMIWLIDGRRGYYINEFGRVGTNMPWKVHDYYEMISEPDLNDFILS